jgi:hypothetical protein
MQALVSCCCNARGERWANWLALLAFLAIGIVL